MLSESSTVLFAYSSISALAQVVKRFFRFAVLKVYLEDTIVRLTFMAMILIAGTLFQHDHVVIDACHAVLLVASRRKPRVVVYVNAVYVLSVLKLASIIMSLNTSLSLYALISFPRFFDLDKQSFVTWLEVLDLDLSLRLISLPRLEKRGVRNQVNVFLLLTFRTLLT